MPENRFRETALAQPRDSDENTIVAIETKSRDFLCGPCLRRDTQLHPTGASPKNVYVIACFHEIIKPVHFSVAVSFKRN